MTALLAELALGAPLFAILVIAADAFAAPRGRAFPLPRRPGATLALLLAAALAFALLLMLTGVIGLAGIEAVAMVAALSLISNIKHKVLGEPLQFSDLALIAAVFQHPQFYVSALRPWQMAVLLGGFAGVVGTLAVFATADAAPRMAGAVIAAAAWAGLRIVLPRLKGTTPVPDAEADVQRLGLVACLLVHLREWRRSADPAPCTATPVSGRSGQLVVIVQCESFTDPVELFGDPALALPGLEKARKLAWQAGRLLVSGFGAYTMRTEYGVLFGRGEAELGPRLFNPFLTASGETSWALPNRLDRHDWRSWFVHPHDLRFYGRDRLMPQSGFGALVGEASFAPPAPGEGRYVTDAAIADKIIDLAQDRSQAGLIYAVTIENHGPWPRQDKGGSGAAEPYLRLLAHGDAMLVRLLDELPRTGRPVTVCFFGDHRPSIPGASEPGAERHTPYVLVRFAADGTPIVGDGAERDMTPAQLHHAILAAIRLGETQGQQNAVAQGPGQQPVKPA